MYCFVMAVVRLAARQGNGFEWMEGWFYLSGAVQAEGCGVGNGLPYWTIVGNYYY